MPKKEPARDSPEQVQQIPIAEIRPFTDHPFRVVDDELMQETVDSIQQFGILNPTIIRPAEDGGYQMVSGHRRLHAAEIAGLSTVPAIVRQMTDDEAIILMVDSNIQRENILPSERAKAYKMKLEAIRRSAGRPSKENGVQVGHNFEGKKSVEIIAEQTGESKSQVQRYIRLTELDPQLLQMVDDGKIGLTPAVEISYLNPEEQSLLVETIDSEQATPSLSQAQRMKKLSQEGKLNDDSMMDIMMEQKKPEGWNLSLPIVKIRNFSQSPIPHSKWKTPYSNFLRHGKKRDSAIMSAERKEILMNITINLNGDLHIHLEADSLLDFMDEMPVPPCMESEEELPVEVTDEEAAAVISVLAKLFHYIGVSEDEKALFQDHRSCSRTLHGLRHVRVCLCCGD